MSDLYIGLMSGTSIDGVDGVLADFSSDSTAGASGALPLTVRAHAHRGFAPELARELLALNSSGHDEIHRGALAANALARRYADVVGDLLQAGGVSAAQVRAIGAHGQTVRHRPGELDGTGYTSQLSAPALLAELTGIDVVADFRSRDVAAGGQGAPLVPAFHRIAFGTPGQTLAVLNIGGIGNLSVLGADERTIGFDCGPGNALMDLWCLRHTGQPYDADGAWAVSGQVIAPLLAVLRTDPFFALPPPKSTGRDLFNGLWLERHIERMPGAVAMQPQDVQATLTELTASTCADAVTRHAETASRLLVCGGGARNGHLMRRIATLLPSLRVDNTDSAGLPSDQVEAAAFAWLARACVRRQPGNLSTVTGASGPRILGAIYAA